MSSLIFYGWIDCTTLSNLSNLKAVPNCLWCQIVRGAKLSVHTLGAKLSAVPNCPFLTLGAKLSAVLNCPFTPLVPNCPRCQIVRFWLLVPNCPRCQIVRLHSWCQIVCGAKLSWCQIILRPVSNTHELPYTDSWNEMPIKLSCRVCANELLSSLVCGKSYVWLASWRGLTRSLRQNS